MCGSNLLVGSEFDVIHSIWVSLSCLLGLETQTGNGALAALCNSEELAIINVFEGKNLTAAIQLTA